MQTNLQTKNRRVNWLRLFAGLTIFISCLGLFGLSSFTAENRIKGNWYPESVGCICAQHHPIIIQGFYKTDFAVIPHCGTICLVGHERMASVISIPYFVSWWIFAVTLLLSVSIALITISFQSVKAALMNPAKSLRSE